MNTEFVELARTWGEDLDFKQKKANSCKKTY